MGWSPPRPGSFIPGKEPRYPLYRKLGWDPGPLWTGAENPAHTGIRSPDRPARRVSLYLLSYPGPWMLKDSIHNRRFFWLLFEQGPSEYDAGVVRRSSVTFSQKYTWNFTPAPELYTLKYLESHSSVRCCWGNGLPVLLFTLRELAATQTQRCGSNADRAQSVPNIGARTWHTEQWQSVTGDNVQLLQHETDTLFVPRSLIDLQVSRDLAICLSQQTVCCCPSWLSCRVSYVQKRALTKRYVVLGFPCPLQPAFQLCVPLTRHWATAMK
jgi:hypothetical protein